MVATNFEYLRAGDVVRLTEPNCDDVPKDMTVTIKLVSDSRRHGRNITVDHITVDDEDVADDVYYESDGYTVEVISYADGLPDAEYIAWTSRDSEKHVALRLPNGTWMFDGFFNTHPSMVAVIDGAEVRPLVERV